MTRSDELLRHVARCLVVLMMATCLNVHVGQAQEAAQASSEQTSSAAAKPGAIGGQSLPDAPERQISQNTPSAEAMETQQNNPQQNNPQQNSPQQNSPQQNSEDVRPLGTAAAPYTRPSGVTGSRPAGAVIAPAKQRRIRTILISVGVIAAAGIAVGTVAALSHGSPSRP